MSVDRWLDAPQVRHVHRLPARSGTMGAWPSWLPAPIRASCERLGIQTLWRHQTEAAEAVRRGRHVVLATGTASGKTLGYLLPVMAATYGGPDAGIAPPERDQDPAPPSLREELLRPRRPHTALYLAPTKALAHDQLRVCAEFDLPTWPVATLDGDTESADRDWARDYAAYVLTNPDMLHRSLLPQHSRWASFLQSLRYVVIDESHRYRGVFGAHVSAVIRRLRRVAALYGAHPVFVLASATSINPGQAAAALTAVSEDDVTVIAEDTSAHGPVEMLLWEPDGHADDDAARLLAELVDAGRQTIAFVSSRKTAERVAVLASGLLTTDARIESYRSGYLADDRRRLERALQQGTLTGVAATNALELGVDIAGMDAVLIAGFPGTMAALWQQAGRAGRRGTAAQVILISRRQPIDAYFFDHPESLFSTPVEATVLHPDNPYVLGPHLAAAAQESPITPADGAYFGATMTQLVERLAAQGVLRARANGWFWTRPERAVDAFDLRSAGGLSIEIIEIETGRVLGHVDPGPPTPRSIRATYLHQGETYLVEELAVEEGDALVRAARPGYYTQPRVLAGIEIVSTRGGRTLGSGQLHLGTVHVTSRVTGFLRRDAITGDVWDETPLDLPEHTLTTDAVWWTVDPRLLPELTPAQLAGGAHAAEHTSIGLLPLYAPCDRWDVAGLSAGHHPDTGLLTVFVHDGQAGGGGFAERGFAVAEQWLGATLARLESCSCASGCPACVVSSTCASTDQVLDKRAAVELLRLLSREPLRC